MHLPDGLIPAPICLGGYGLTGLTTWLCLRRIDRHPDPSRGIARAALLTAAFFAASSLRIPIPPASVHLVLNGLLGVMLGAFAFPAVLVGLTLQALLFGHGGMTTLGVNAVLMGWPALVAGAIFQRRLVLRPWLGDRGAALVASGVAGSVALGLSTAIFFVIALGTITPDLNEQAERAALLGLAIAHGPVILLEGLFTAAVVGFLQRVNPELLEGLGGPPRSPIQDCP
ncbi:MAG: cobalt transporter CbiM [Cyanobacteria bacterium]|nr:cobalt transporter CbiM [Cyanobacteriota bacterium]